MPDAWTHAVTRAEARAHDAASGPLASIGPASRAGCGTTVSQGETGNGAHLAVAPVSIALDRAAVSG